MKRLFFYTIATLVTSSVLLMPAHAGWLPNKKDQPSSEQEVEETIAQFLQFDKGLQEFFDHVYGYAVFPKIYKGAIGVGAAYGSGWIY